MRRWIGLVLLFCASVAMASDTLIIMANKIRGQFVVSLPANPTTGYQWTIESFDKKLLQLSKSEYITPKTQLVGQGGHTDFYFHLIKGQVYPKSLTLHFKYARTWEKNSGRRQDVIVLLK